MPNDSQSVINIFEKLYLELRPDMFMELFPVLLADNGSEFSNPKAIEFDKQGNRRTHLSTVIPMPLTRKEAVKTTTK